MICIEIRKGGQDYRFTLTGEEATEFSLGEAYDFAVDLATGKTFFTGENSITDLGTSKDYEAIKVWQETPAVEVGPPKLPALEDNKNYIKPFSDHIFYLGQSLMIKGVKALEDGVPFVLIYDVDGQPAQTQASRETIVKLSHYQGQVLGYKNPIVINPQGDIYSEEDALEYVEDYLGDLRKERQTLYNTQDLSATAFTNFTKDE
jgi:hypothetical protein